MLEARDLCLHGPDGAVALADLTVFGHPGDLLVVLGGHGAGKSALLRTIAGLARPEAGTVRLDGEDLGALGPHARAARGIAYIGDGGRVAEPLSVHDNLLLGAWRRRDRRAVREDLSEWLHRFPVLAGMARRRAGDLGAAERVAVALGRAWIAGPRVLLIDEPFTGLDEEARAGVAGALRAARDAGQVVICAVHEPGDASVASRVNVLSNGRLVFSGSPGALATTGAAALLE
ncbi:MAG TPA: ATP-binding cassette domain-containing protein [bacterium]|nr:ATP-binding cassette domain-containing protein [bacterium]